MVDTAIHDFEESKISPKLHFTDEFDALLLLVNLPDAKVLLSANAYECLGSREIPHNLYSLPMNGKSTVELLHLLDVKKTD